MMAARQGLPRRGATCYNPSPDCITEEEHAAVATVIARGGEDAHAGAQETTPIGDQWQSLELLLGSGREKPTTPAVVRNSGCNAGGKLEPKVTAR
jgi:hypothetical protein